MQLRGVVSLQLDPGVCHAAMLQKPRLQCTLLWPLYVVKATIAEQQHVSSSMVFDLIPA